ncbi:MAG: hypothetical protein JWQ73_1130 [Variovorax sp.]|nr:hypothetical protein [Variovorax sp.]
MGAPQSLGRPRPPLRLRCRLMLRSWQDVVIWITPLPRTLSLLRNARSPPASAPRSMAFQPLGRLVGWTVSLAARSTGEGRASLLAAANSLNLRMPRDEARRSRSRSAIGTGPCRSRSFPTRPCWLLWHPVATRSFSADAIYQAPLPPPSLQSLQLLATRLQHCGHLLVRSSLQFGNPRLRPDAKCRAPTRWPITKACFNRPTPARAPCDVFAWHVDFL